MCYLAAIDAQDMSDSMFEESEVAKTVREVRARDPAFDMVAFLRSLRQDVAPVIQARTPFPRGFS
jgi:import inner membrane translocase subunit TIM44